MIIDETDLGLIRNLYRNKIIVLCHGCFDVFHYGHLTYLKESKKLGDELVVSLTNDKFINKGESRPIFDFQRRLEIIDELKCVSYCCISNDFTAVNVIRRLKPHIYSKATDVRGKELDPTENLYKEVQTLSETGGKLVFIEKVSCISSTEIIRRLK